VFCPNEEVLKSGLEHGKMPVALYEKIIDELAETQPNRVSLYLMNEPVSDKRLPDFVGYLSERIPKTTSLVTSNGTKLTEERAEALIEAGLKRLKVSLQSLDPETNREIMGYGSERVIENILGVQRAIQRLRPKHFDFRVSMVVTSRNASEIEEARTFWRRHGVRLVTSALENRGGNIAIAEDLNGGDMRRRTECIRPSREMCVLYNGDVVLCCVDWHRTVTLGNLAESSVRDVWNGHRLTDIRRAFREDDVESLPEICVNCSESAAPDRHRRGLRGVLSRLVGASA
jgi:MoaA/NifB/PqqE/SkfB family radical SAM enzyme